MIHTINARIFQSLFFYYAIHIVLENIEENGAGRASACLQRSGGRPSAGVFQVTDDGSGAFSVACAPYSFRLPLPLAEDVAR